ncbi:MAG: hypothetical protein JO077_21460 [Verrucomicrobia bacterium]|nr:hypothetical protein [Verrucomicrobiota bacterium]
MKSELLLAYCLLTYCLPLTADWFRPAVVTKTTAIVPSTISTLKQNGDTK